MKGGKRVSRSSGSGIGIGGILFAIFMVYNLFSDDDEDSREVVIEDQDKGVIEEIKDAVEEIKPEVQQAITEAKEALAEATKDLTKDTEGGIDEKDEKVTKKDPPTLETYKPKPEKESDDEGIKL